MKKIDDETKEKFLVLAMLTPVPDTGSKTQFHRVAERYHDLLHEHGYTPYSLSSFSLSLSSSSSFSRSSRHIKERFPNL